MPDSAPILTINNGSSSMRLALFEWHAQDGVRLLAAAQHARDDNDPQAMLQHFLEANGVARPSMVAHRVVHGGEYFSASCLLDAAAEREIERLALLAPLHNPVALAWIRAARTLLGAGVPQVGVFDTAFYASLPVLARTYAIPADLARKHALRRYGFHGLAHQSMARHWRQLHPAGAARVISLQLGAGCSITASLGGKPLDTSMGFSPLEGLMMATRSGDIDAGLVTFLQRQEGLTPQQTETLLNQHAGLLGVSGISADMAKLLESDDPKATLAVDLYCYRARKYVGAYLAVLGGADAVVFGGGVGENAPAIRARILAGLEWAGLAIDAEANAAATGTQARISRSDSPIEVWVLPVNEAVILAEQAVAVVQKKETQT